MELKLYNTTSSKLNSLNIVGGQLIVSKDDSCLYVDIDSIGRLKITDWIELETDNDRLAVLAPISGKIYYVSKTNAIWKYVKGSWKCLNEVNKEEIFEYVLENLQSYLDAKVPTSRKINGKVLTSDITLSASDVGATTQGYVDNQISALGNTYYTENEIDAKIDDINDAIDTKSDNTHNHNDDYSAINHKHTVSEVTDISSHYYNQTQIDSKINTINNNIENKSDVGHGHSIAEITNLQTSLNDKVSTSRRINNKPLTSDITITAADLGALTTSDIVSVKNEVNDYTDQQIANLLNNSTEAVDSIYELRDAMEDNADAIESLVAISGNKANASDLANHINNKSNPHNVTKEQLGLYASTWYGTKVEYDAIENKQEDCLYIVTDYTADGMYEVVTNKINVINKNSTDEQYPTAKAVYDVIDSHVSNKENPHNVTAEQIGAVPITGATLKGHLGINNGYGKVESYDANVLLRTMYPANDSNNSRRITLYNKNNKDDTRYALQLNETINGATTSYNIYGEHNKDLLVKALPIISNPNLLDNWYFADPINQRGQTEYTEAGYTIDRWKNTYPYGSTVLHDGYVSLTGIENQHFLKHVFENSLLGKTLTFSALTLEGELITATATMTTSEQYPVDNGTMVLMFGADNSLSIVVKQGKTANVVAVKSELGSQQTIARQENGVWVLNDPPPNKQQELAKCQRYCYIPASGGDADKSQVFLGVGLVRWADAADINIPLPCSMRAVPSIEYSGLNLFDGVKGYVVQTLDVYSHSKSLNNTNLMLMVFSGGMTQGTPIELFLNESTGRFIISADL